ncbi:hypothetical protein EH11_04187 [Bacillus subtilis]|nr:hypothetical protein DAD79_11055 [Bacillus sp. Rc4]RPJ98107.1 hypothetical protein EH11_04187 [Bacillus subtilis]RPK10637.1 hypothetical protein EH5_03475 [Bacillus subtilis]RUS03558.1 hypothetical protein EFW59_04155 [Bacillus subtilis]
MKKLTSIIIPLFFILVGIGCLTLSSTVFNTNGFHQDMMKSFFGICIFMFVPMIFAIIYLILIKKR